VFFGIGVARFGHVAGDVTLAVVPTIAVWFGVVA